MTAHAYILREDVPSAVSRAVRYCESIEEPVWSFSVCRFTARPHTDDELEFVVPRDWTARRELFEWFEYFGIPYRVLP
ncbi:hypothetical protein KTE17_07595 [Burkholderia gladioli]|uniref:hypothetical protein n=1 Tax=Burkholderia gladioli TaxID=28095 RepID=UPI00055AB322|nr:hypothetical protein [Burkholderia gladioli]ASD79016.1 hypothetical protein CEJ98_08335 [Burkholderia gladioli pv. gladioli]MBU9272923.1 hypothetical protein [Burkholderia gladioli]